MVTIAENQKGMALVFALLVMMMLTAFTAILCRDAIREVVFTRSYSDGQGVFYAAETAMRRGSNWLINQPGTPEPDYTDGLYSLSGMLPPDAVDNTNDPATASLPNSYSIDFIKTGNGSTQSAKLSGNYNRASNGTAGLSHYYRISGQGSITNKDYSKSKLLQIIYAANF